MRFVLLIICLNISLVLSSQTDAVCQQAIVEKVIHQKEYLLECINLLDESDLQFRPTETSMTTRELLLHMSGNMLWISRDYLEGGTFDTPYDRKDLSKSELNNYLSQVFDYAIASLEGVNASTMRTKVDFFAGEKNVLQLMELLDDHLTHHKGQLTIYLQLLGKKAPRFVGW